MNHLQNTHLTIEEAKNIIDKHALRNYMDLLFDYWAQNPPTLGHGFAHVLKVAVNSYKLGTLNNYATPDHLFVGGLFHDIYRPAKGQDGEEDQTHGAAIVTELFVRIGADLDLTEKVVNMINSHDAWRTQDAPPIYDLLVSLGDKWAHDPHCFYPYMWSSNKYLKMQGKDISFDSHLRALTSFVRYQQRAWEIFYKYKDYVKGTENAIYSYLKAYQEFAKNYEEDKPFLDKVSSYAKEYKDMEVEVLSAFFDDKEKIARIIIDGKEL